MMELTSTANFIILMKYLKEKLSEIFIFRVSKMNGTHSVYNIESIGLGVWLQTKICS